MLRNFRNGITSGLQEFGTGNNFGYCAFTTFGSFWISLSLMLIGNHFDVYKSDHETIGYFLLAFTLYSAIMTVATLGLSCALFVTFVLLLVGFVLLDIAHFHHIHAPEVAAGWLLLFCALGAWYVMAHLIYLETFKKNLLPVGPAPISLIKQGFLKSRSDASC